MELCFNGYEFSILLDTFAWKPFFRDIKYDNEEQRKYYGHHSCIWIYWLWLEIYWIRPLRR